MLNIEEMLEKPVYFSLRTIYHILPESLDALWTSILCLNPQKEISDKAKYQIEYSAASEENSYTKASYTLHITIPSNHLEVPEKTYISQINFIKSKQLPPCLKESLSPIKDGYYVFIDIHGPGKGHLLKIHDVLNYYFDGMNFKSLNIKDSDDLIPKIDKSDLHSSAYKILFQNPKYN